MAAASIAAPQQHHLRKTAPLASSASISYPYWKSAVLPFVFSKTFTKKSIFLVVVVVVGSGGGGVCACVW